MPKGKKRGGRKSQKNSDVQYRASAAVPAGIDEVTSAPRSPLRRWLKRIGGASAMVGLAAWMLSFIGFDNLTLWIRRPPPQPENNQGILVSVMLPEKGFFPPTFRIRSERRELQDGNIWCYFNVLRTGWGDEARENFIEPEKQRFERLQVQTGWVDHECTPPLKAEWWEVTHAEITLDIDLAIVGEVGRYFALRTFRLERDRIGMATWVLVGSQTGPAERRPPSVVDEVRQGIPPRKKQG